MLVLNGKGDSVSTVECVDMPQAEVRTRKLASVQVVNTVEPIDGEDAIAV